MGASGGVVARARFEAVCSELERSLGREREAAALLRGQARQLAEVSGRCGRRQRWARRLERRVRALTALGQSCESELLRERALLLGYCGRVAALVEGPLRAAVGAGALLAAVRRVAGVEFAAGEGEEGGSGALSPESLACQSIVNLFCITFNMLIVKLYPKDTSLQAGLAEEKDSAKEDISFDSSEKSNILVSSNYDSETSLNLGKDYVDFSFQQLPLYHKQTAQLKAIAGKAKKQKQTAA